MLSPLEVRIKFIELDPRLRGSELPVGLHLGLVAALGSRLGGGVQVGPFTEALGGDTGQGA
jgi:hypothetical protein